MKFLVNLNEYKVNEISSYDEFINGIKDVKYSFNFINGSIPEVSLKNVSDFINTIRGNLTSNLYKLIDPDYLIYNKKYSEIQSLLEYHKTLPLNNSNSIDDFNLEFSDYLFMGKIFSLKWIVYTNVLSDTSYLVFSLINLNTNLKDIYIKIIGSSLNHENLKGQVSDFVEKINSNPSNVFESFDFYFKDKSFYSCLNYYYLKTMRTEWGYENSSNDSKYVDYFEELLEKSENKWKCIEELLIKFQK